MKTRIYGLRWTLGPDDRVDAMLKNFTNRMRGFVRGAGKRNETRQSDGRTHVKALRSQQSILQPKQGRCADTPYTL